MSSHQRNKNINNEELALVYMQYFDDLINFGLKYTADHTIIEDAIQEIFTDLYRRKTSLSGIQNIRFYLIKSVKRKIIKELQKSKQLLLKNDFDNETTFIITYSIEKSIIKEEENFETRQKLLNALESLSDRQREAIYLKYYFSLKYSEISDLLGINIESCRTLIFRAMKVLKNSIDAA